MTISVLLLIVYGLLCTVAVGRLRFFRKSGIKPGVLKLLFGIHVAIGWLHNYIAYRYYPEHGDIWTQFWNSYQPGNRFFSDIGIWLSDNSGWTYVSHDGIIYIHMILNLVSFSNMAINTLLFALPVFLGNVALYRVFRRRFPDDPLTSFSVFLLPSILFWTSCVHREGMLYMLLGFLLYHVHRLQTKRFYWPQAAWSLLCFVFIAYFRIAFAITLLPALYCWLLIENRVARRKLILAGAIALVLLATLVLPVIDLPAAIARVQHEFMSLDGHSRLSLPALDGSWESIFRILPAALRNGCFEPLPGSGGQPIYLAFSIELLAIWAIVLFGILRKIRNDRNPNFLNKEPLLGPFGFFCLLFTLFGMLEVGITVPFAGAIVRYRSIYLLFLLAPFLHSLRTLPFIQGINEWIGRNLLHRL